MRLKVRGNDVFVVADEDKERKSLRLKGSWRLDEQHQLSYQVEGKGFESLPRMLKFQTDLVSLDHNALGVLITHSSKGFAEQTVVFQLKGQWIVDRYNRLRFKVKRMKGSSDRLRFDGHWDLNQEHHIVYTAQQTATREKQKLVLKGQWKMLDDRYLAYYFQLGKHDPLIIRAYLQTRHIRSKKDHIRYRWGVGFHKSKRSYRKISFWGLWKVSHDLDVQFSLDQNRAGWTYRFTVKALAWTGGRWMLSLKHTQRSRSTLQLRLDQSFFQSSKAFVAWTKHMQESWGVRAGITIAF